MKLRLPLLLLLLMMVSLSGCVDSVKMNTLSLSGQPLPVLFDNADNPDGLPGSYWVGTAQITGDDTKYTLTLPDGTTDGASTTSKSVIIQISGIDTRLEAAVEEQATQLTYLETDLIGPDWAGFEVLEEKTVPYYNVGVNRQLIATADIAVSLPTGSIKHSTISTYGQDTIVQIPVTDNSGIQRTIYFKAQGIQLASGNLPPNGDLSVIQKPLLGYQLVKSDDLYAGVYSWNQHVWDEYYNTLKWIHTDTDSWSDAFNWMAANGHIPDRSPTIAASTEVVTGDDAKIIIRYPTTVFAPLVTVYIPNEIAETITLNEQTPEFRFDRISQVKGIEGGSHRLKVTGTAVGTGTIRLSVDSPAVKADRWVNGSEKQIVKGTSYTFYTDLEFNTALEANTEYKATVHAMPAGLGTPASQDFAIYLADKDTVQTHTIRIYAIYEDSGDQVTNAPLYLGYGSDRLVGYGDSTRAQVPAGTYQVYSRDVSGWYAAYTEDHPRSVTVDKDKSVEILFSREPVVHTNNGFSLWLPVGAVLVVLIMLFMFYGGGFQQPIYRMLHSVTSNPYFWLFLIVLVAGSVGIYVYMDLVGRIENLTSAVENFEIF